MRKIIRGRHIVVDRPFIWSGARWSTGAKLLADRLGSKLLWQGNIDRVKYIATQRTKTVINWGSSIGHSSFVSGTYLNDPSRIKNTDKLRFFRYISEVNEDLRSEVISIPQWTTSRDSASQWETIVARSITNGHSGLGITICKPDQLLSGNIHAPLYVKYIKKDAEFRVHVVRGQVIDIQRKVRDPDREPTNWQVRSHENGFIYVRQDVTLTPEMERQAKLALEITGLDFGAVDIIYNRRQDKYFVLEVNSAPGLEGTTLEKYAAALGSLL